ncbi:MAG: hypothetical protein HQ500_08420 [Flavobacteriales bacterium]|nr:hypothetical protein [Flavobacteriales bacterium]
MKTRPLLALILVTALWSCGGEDQATKKVDMTDDALSEESSEPEESGISGMADFKFHTMVANLPSPLETFHIIEGHNIALTQAALTPIEQADGLSTASAKAYGYGVYMTDMGCMAYNHQNQQTLDYFQVCRTLASDLGAGDVFERTISQNFEENTSSEEQFVRMMNDAFDAMDQYMVDNERFVNATEIFVGSWVETQIIATRILKGKEMTEDNMPVYEGIYSQKVHTSNLMNVLGEIDQEISDEVLSAVEDIMMFYAGFSSVESISQDDLTQLETKLMTLKNLLLA